MLITLGIIGIIAALTMPSLIQKNEKKIAETRLKEAYSILSQAMLLAQKDYGEPKDWDNPSGKALSHIPVIQFCETYIVPYLSGAKVHGWTTLSDIGIKNGYTAMNGNPLSNGNLASYMTSYNIELKNSQILFFSPDNDGTVITNIIVYVDINGKKNPNTLGKDAFLFKYDLKHNKITAYGDQFNYEEIKKKCTKESEWDSLMCAQLIMLDGWKINYW